MITIIILSIGIGINVGLSYLIMRNIFDFYNTESDSIGKIPDIQEEELSNIIK